MDNTNKILKAAGKEYGKPAHRLGHDKRERLQITSGYTYVAHDDGVIRYRIMSTSAAGRYQFSINDMYEHIEDMVRISRAYQSGDIIVSAGDAIKFTLTDSTFSTAYFIPWE